MAEKFYNKKFQKNSEVQLLEEAVERTMREAEIICCTLNSSGSEKLDRYDHRIEAVIVDEACQSTEPSCIIPLRFRANKLILIGDPQQLSATTFNQGNKSTRYDRSLFEVYIYMILENGRLWGTPKLSRHAVQNDA